LERIKALFRHWQSILEVWREMGPWGPFVIGAIDAAAFGIPLDFVVGDYAWAHRGSVLWVGVGIVLASAGSALGSLVPYWIGRKGGEPFLLKKISHDRLVELRDRYEKREFFFLMIPAMLPPPTPMKLLTFAAGTFEMRVPIFLSAITLGRILRFILLSSLVVAFGPEKIKQAARQIAENWVVALAIFAALIVSAIVLWRWKVRPARAR